MGVGDRTPWPAMPVRKDARNDSRAGRRASLLGAHDINSLLSRTDCFSCCILALPIPQFVHFWGKSFTVPTSPGDGNRPVILGETAAIARSANLPREGRFKLLCYNVIPRSSQKRRYASAWQGSERWRLRLESRGAPQSPAASSRGRAAGVRQTGPLIVSQAASGSFHERSPSWWNHRA